MMRNPEEVERFEKSWRAAEPVDPMRMLKLFEDFIRLARTVGVWPAENPLEGIEVDIRLARVLNVREPA